MFAHRASDSDKVFGGRGKKKQESMNVKLGREGKKKGWEMMSAMFTRAYLTQGGSSRHYYTSISEHCVIFLDILFLS